MAPRATSVLALDSSEAAAAATVDNARSNGLGNVIVRAVNVFDELRELEIAGTSFDTVVLDPPAFAKNRGAVERALAGYKEINLRALRLLRPGGYLLTCSCSYNVDEALFLETVRQAAVDAPASVSLVEKRLQARDHPVLVWRARDILFKVFGIAKASLTVQEENMLRSLLLVPMLLLAVAAPAAAQWEPGVRAGVSADPDQFYFGGHVETRPLIDRLSFRPNVEVGFGDDCDTCRAQLRVRLLDPGRPAAVARVFRRRPGRQHLFGRRESRHGRRLQPARRRPTPRRIVHGSQDRHRRQSRLQIHRGVRVRQTLSRPNRRCGLHFPGRSSNMKA
jgi:hypothetical protein